MSNLTSNVVRQDSSAIPKEMQALVETLEEYLDSEVSVWSWDESKWNLVIGATGEQESNSSRHNPDNWHDSEGLIEKPIVLPSAGGERRVVVPLGSKSGQTFLATCLTNLSSEQALEQLVEMSTEIGRSRHLISDLDAECESSAMQLATDLEELATLRDMVARLTAIDSCDESLLAMARETLPSMNEVIRAESLAYVSSRERHRNPEFRALLTIGPGKTTDETFAAIINNYGAAAQDGALVRNWGVKDTPTIADQEEELASVRSLVLAPIKVESRVKGWVVAVNRVRQSSSFECSWQLATDEFGSGEGTLLDTAASVMSMHATGLEMLREKEQLLINMVRTLVSAIEAKDPYTCGHSERVALFSKRLASEIGYNASQIENLYLSALLHDVGKIGVSDATLKKPGKLTDEEYEEISRHPDEGWSILADLDQLRQILPGVLHHHERWDGKGYPDQLVGVDIPLDARVMAVVDAYDAMTSDRPYRDGMANEKAESILREGAGTQWDPDCVDAFFDCLDDIHEIQRTYEPHIKRERTH